MKRVIANLLVLCLIAPTAAASGLQVIPKWTFEGERACYGATDAKQLLRLDSELVACREQIPRYRLSTESLRTSVEKLKAALSTRETQVTLLTTELNASIDREKELVKRANYAEAKGPDLTMPLIAGGVGVGLGILFGLLIAGARAP